MNKKWVLKKKRNIKIICLFIQEYNKNVVNIIMNSIQMFEIIINNQEL